MKWLSALFGFVFVSCSANQSLAATYDATGMWIATFSANKNDCGAESVDNEPASIEQINNTFSLTIYDETITGGTIDAATYTITARYLEDDGTTTETYIITLSSATEGTGSYTGSWTDGGEPCTWDGDITLVKNTGKK
jgi:hypothetical protein